MTRPIFIHGLFRCGSTYFFDKFRSDGRYQCYYEPFHHVIGDLDAKKIDIWNHSGKTSKRMNHPLLDRPHFYEYLECFELGRIKHFDKKLSYDRFYLSSDSSFSLEKNYIDNLIHSSPSKKIPVLQFNRSSFRLNFFVDNYPACHHIYLLRSPRNQFKSYVASGQIFLVINLILASRISRNVANPLFYIEFFEDDNIQKEIAHYSFLSFKIKLRDHYKIFLYLWCWSLFYAFDSGCEIIDVDNLSKDDLIKKLKAAFIDNINFDDFKTAQSDAGFILSSSEARAVEEAVFDSFLSHKKMKQKAYYDPYKYVSRSCIFQKKLRLNYYRKLIYSIAFRLYYRFKFRVYLKIKKRFSLRFYAIKNTFNNYFRLALKKILYSRKGAKGGFKKPLVFVVNIFKKR